MKLVVRVRGGLGNQLFSYAAARRLAIYNGCDLIIDNVTGFCRDFEYKRQYRLDRFSIPCNLAKPSERFWPFERSRRAISKYTARMKAFESRNYIEEELLDFDERLLRIKLSNKLTTIDGLWQSEAYFKDTESVIRQDLAIKQPTDPKNLNALSWIKNNQAVAIHIRWFGGANSASNVPRSYYINAISQIKAKIEKPYFVIFSDDPGSARQFLNLQPERTLLVDWNNYGGGEVDDLWLMTQCQNYIIANSTFSWWGAWLGSHDQNKIVYYPKINQKNDWSWNYNFQMPKNWRYLIVG